MIPTDPLEYTLRRTIDRNVCCGSGQHLWMAGKARANHAAVAYAAAAASTSGWQGKLAPTTLPWPIVRIG